MATKRKDEAVIGVRLSGDLRQWAERVAKSDDLTLSQVVRRALAQARSLWGENGSSRPRTTPDAARKVGGA